MKNSPVQKSSETGKLELELIKGKFSSSEAQEILGHIIQKKIDYHTLRSFSHSERFGVPDQWSESRTKELSLSFEMVQDIIARAREEGNYLVINSSISIEVVPS